MRGQAGCWIFLTVAAVVVTTTGRAEPAPTDSSDVAVQGSEATPDGGAARTLTPEEQQAEAVEQFEASLSPRHGTVTLEDGLAELRLPNGYAYLSPADTDKLLQAWGNPPSPETLGMLYPTGLSLFHDDAWAVIISFAEDGYVEDDDAEDIDYDDLLSEMKEGTAEENEARTQAGYPPISLIGWAEPPHYNAETHKIYWAKELAFGDQPEHSLNYAIRALGRRGVLELNAVATMRQLPRVKANMEQVLGFVEFNEGHRYADFDPDLDEVAAYGIGALIAGKVAAKAGLLKGLFAILLASKKLVVAGVVGLGLALRGLLGKKKDDA